MYTVKLLKYLLSSALQFEVSQNPQNLGNMPKNTKADLIIRIG
jgi:hypothetical protein